MTDGPKRRRKVPRNNGTAEKGDPNLAKALYLLRTTTQQEPMAPKRTQEKTNTNYTFEEEEPCCHER